MKNKSKKFDQLRTRAEKLVMDNIEDSLNNVPDDKKVNIQKTIYELQVHQIELELQNEELLNAQCKLDKSHQQYKDLYEFAPVGYLTLDAEGTIKNANYTTAELLNTNLTRLKESNFNSYVAKNERDKFYLSLKKIFKSEEKIEVELELDPQKTEDPRFVLLTGKINKDQTKFLCRIALTDITKQTLAEKLTKENEQRLKHAQEIGSLGYWSIQSEDQTFVWSDIIYKIFNRRREIGPPTIQEFLECCYPGHRQMLKESFLSALKYKKEFNVDFKVVLGDNVEKCFTATGKPVVKDGKVEKVEGIIQDITDRKKLEQELRELNATKDKFFSIISHDLKGPLNIIIGMSKLLSQKKDQHKYEEFDELVGFIKESSEQTMNLLENLLTWARSQTGRLDFNPRPLSVRNIIEDIIELLKGALKEKNLKIKNNVPEKLTINADHHMMRAVIRNLILNAIKFSYDGSADIIISAEKKKNEVVITLQDFGTGIKPIHKEKLFHIDKTFSVDGTKDERGTGLGLILSKEFVEKHGGKIDVESEEGKGSTFYLTLPQENNNAN